MTTGEGRNCCVFGRGPMRSATGDVEVASGIVRRIEDFEASKRDERVEDVRPGVARRLGITAEALRNIRRQRRKTIPAWLMSAILRAWIEALETEIATIEHELGILQTLGADPRSDAFSATRARATALYRLLEATA